MDEPNPAPIKYIEEKRLIKTMITGRPSGNAFLISAFTILITVAFTLFYWRAPEAWSSLLPVVKNQIFQNGQIWRVVTGIFIHADIEHLLSNLLLLSVFSFFIFGYFGFGVFPVLSFLMAAFVNLLAAATYSPEIELLGASGLVYLLGGFWLTLYFFIQRQYRGINRFMRVVGTAMMIFLPSTFAPTTSYRTHAIGFFIGIIMGLVHFYQNKEEIRSHEVYKISFVEE